jgi:hypothetical protein
VEEERVVPVSRQLPDLPELRNLVGLAVAEVEVVAEVPQVLSFFRGKRK